MCLAVPGRITEIGGEDPLERIGKVDFGGIMKNVHLAYVPEANVGDYVIVHVGFAINVLDEDEAREILETFEQLDEVMSRADGVME